MRQALLLYSFHKEQSKAHITQQVPLSALRSCGVPGCPSWACWMGVWGRLHLPAMGTESRGDLRPLSSRKELSHEEAPRRRSRKSRAVSR